MRLEQLGIKGNAHGWEVQLIWRCPLSLIPPYPDNNAFNVSHGHTESQLYLDFYLYQTQLCCFLKQLCLSAGGLWGELTNNSPFCSPGMLRFLVVSFNLHHIPGKGMNLPTVAP